MTLAGLTIPQMIPRPALAAGALASAWALASLFWTAGSSFLPALHLATLAAAYVLGLWLRPRLFWLAYCGVATLLMLFTLRTPDWFYLNPNFLGAIFCLGLIGAAVYRLWLALPLLLVGLLGTQSRGALIATGVCGWVMLWREFRTWAYISILGAILFAATIKGSPVDSMLGRLGVWQDTLAHLTPLGAGWGSFADAYASWPRHTNRIDGIGIAPHAYNDVLQLTFELGLGSILVWVWVALSLDRSAPHERMVPLAFALLGLTYFPLWLPGVAHAFVFALGTASKGSD